MTDESFQQPSLEEWAAQRELITRLYSSKKLQDVMGEMESRGFKASEAVYKKRFRQWGIRKNMSAERALEIFKRKRESRADDTPGNGSALIGGNGDSDENIARHIKRLKARGVDVDGHVSSSSSPGLDTGNSSPAPNRPTTSAMVSPPLGARPAEHGSPGVSLPQPSLLHPTGAFTSRYNVGASSSFHTSSSPCPADVVGDQPNPSVPVFQDPHHDPSDVAAFKALINDLFHIDNPRSESPRSPASPHFSDDEHEVVEISSSGSASSSESSEPTDDEAVQMHPIHHAAMFGRLGAVELLLRIQPSCVHATTNEGMTPLWLAARGDFVDVASALVRAGADLNVTSGDLQNTPLLEAVTRFNHGMVRFLIEEANADPNQENKNGVSPLSLACYKGPIGIVKILIEGGADVNRATLHFRQTPLHIACISRNPEVLDLLLESGAAVDKRDAGGSTPLCQAVKEGNPDAARLLLYHGADPNIPEDEGSSYPLHHAVEEDHSEMVEWLLDHGADPNVTTSSGWSPLTDACNHGNANIVRLLLQHKANVNHRIKKTITALHIAAQEGHADVVNVLLDHGAHPQDPESDAHPINLAARNGHLDTVKVLVQRGADVNSKTFQDKYILNPLCIAAESGHVPVMEYLIEQGASM